MIESDEEHLRAVTNRRLKRNLNEGQMLILSKTQLKKYRQANVEEDANSQEDVEALFREEFS